MGKMPVGIFSVTFGIAYTSSYNKPAMTVQNTMVLFPSMEANLNTLRCGRKKQIKQTEAWRNFQWL